MKKPRAQSRAKGAAGENGWAKTLSSITGLEAWRTQAFVGHPEKGASDVTCPELPIHWEVKRTERVQLYKWLEQAVGDCAEGKIPVVAHRQNNKEWVCVIRATDFLNLIKPR